MFPHVIEPLQCFDDPDIDEITMQWGAQTGKTFFAQLCLASTLANNPFPCAFADMNEDGVIEVFRRFWALLDYIPSLKDVLPEKQARKNNAIITSVAKIHGAWAGSPRKAKDYGAKVVILNECDAMTPTKTGTEADFRLAIRDRTFGYQQKKIISISTPSMAGSSYIEAQRLIGDNRTWMVPCPHCKHYQRWKTGNGKDPGGLRWDRPAGGGHHAGLAFETAWYECESCRGKIRESHRMAMCNAGLWVPEGCRVEDGKVVGTPARAGRHASFGPPHALTSLLAGVTINSLAKDRVECLTAKNRGERLRNWMNSVEGVVYDPAPECAEPTIIQARMASDDKPGICPEWTKFVTIGCDVSQMGPMDFLFHWWVSAWGLGGRGAMVECGVSQGRKAFREFLEKSLWPVANRMGRYRPSRCYIDSGDGDMTASIYQYCDQLHSLPFPVTPIKGSSNQGKKEEDAFSKNDAGYRLSKGAFRGEDKPWKRALKEKARKYDLILINTHLSQLWVEDRLQGRIRRDEESWYSIPAFYFTVSPSQPFDIVRNITGDYLYDGKWLKRIKSQDLRDAWRYSAVGAEQHTKDGRDWATVSDTLIQEGGPGLAASHFEGQRGIAGPFSGLQ